MMGGCVSVCITLTKMMENRGAVDDTRPKEEAIRCAFLLSPSSHSRSFLAHTKCVYVSDSKCLLHCFVLTTAGAGPFGLPCNVYIAFVSYIRVHTTSYACESAQQFDGIYYILNF
jgi:hypothetical protein